MDEIASVILQIFVLLVFAKILGSIFERFNMPKLIGEILAGLIFINALIFYPPFQDLIGFYVDDFNDPGTVSFFHIMGELGIIFLLFAVGLETKFSDMMKVGKKSAYIAVLGVVIPFVCGLLLFFVDDLITVEAALLIGAALFGTSTAVGVECLRNLDAMNSNEAKLIVSATVIDDILCLALLGVIIGAIKPDADITSIVLNAVIVVAFVLCMFLFISRVKKIAARRRKLMHQMSRKKKEQKTDAPPEPEPMTELGALGLAIIVCLGLAALSVNIGLAAIIGAFLAGMIFAEFKSTVPVEDNFNVIIYFMLPFFFIWVGMEVQFSPDRGITAAILPMLCIVLVAAVGSKYVAGFIGGKLGKLSNDSCHLIGVSFIPRGEVGIIVATIGLTQGVFKSDIFTIIILMALITAIITPPLVAHAYRRLERNRSAVFEEIFEGR